MLKGFITNLGKYNEGELIGKWIQFPIDEEELEEVFAEIGISDEPDEDGVYYEEYFFTDWECPVDLDLGEYENIERVNEIAEMLEDDRFKAACEYFGLSDALEMNLEDVILYQDIENCFDLGYYIAHECGLFHNVPEDVERYFDFDSYGRDININAHGGFTSYGWMEYIG